MTTGRVRRTSSASVALLDDDLSATRDAPPHAVAEGAADRRRHVHAGPRAVLSERREDVLARDAQPVLAGTRAAVPVGLAVGSPAGRTAARRGLRAGRAGEPDPCCEEPDGQGVHELASHVFSLGLVALFARHIG